MEQLEISYGDVKKTPQLESLIESKAKRLEKFCKNLISCQIAVSSPHAHQDSGSGIRVRIEVRIPPNHQLVAHEHSSHGEIHDSAETVARRAFDAIERQVKDLMSKLHENQEEREIEEGPGTVLVVDPEKRFGIIKTPAGRDVYFTASSVTNDEFDRITVGTAVDYVDEPGEEGPRASTVRIVEKKGKPMVLSGSRG